MRQDKPGGRARQRSYNRAFKMRLGALTPPFDVRWAFGLQINEENVWTRQSMVLWRSGNQRRGGFCLPYREIRKSRASIQSKSPGLKHLCE